MKVRVPHISGLGYVMVIRVSAVLAVLAIAWATAYGAWFHIPYLANPFGSSIRVDLTIHLAFVITGISMLLLTEKPSGLRANVARLLAGIVIAISLSHSDISTPQIKVDLFLCGVCLLALSANRDLMIRSAQLCALIIGCSAGISMLGNTYGLSTLRFLPYFSNMPIPTGLMFHLAAIALLLMRPQIGVPAVLVSKTLGGAVARWLLVPILFAYPLLGFVTGVGPKYQLDLTVIVLLSNFMLPLLIWSIAITLDRSDRAKASANELLVDNERLNGQLNRLLVSEENAREALKAKTQFITNISHELRTPLSAIISGLELSLQISQSAEHRELTKTVHESAESLLRIVNDLLDFSSLSLQKFELHHADFSVRALLSETVGKLRALANSKNIKITTIVEPNVPETVNGDGIRIKQVLINLIGNALKFTEHGTVTVQITNSRCCDRAALTFSVTDTGIGLSPDDQKKIFEQFTQADSSTKRHHGGLGLGLSISKTLVELMGGNISVSSSIGEGSTFWFVIPVGSADARAEAATSSGDNKDSNSASEAGKHLILIVEDSPVNAKMLSLQLRKLGYPSHIAQNGREAVDAVSANNNYSLVLMDWQMPVMDGVEATRVIRSMESPVRSIPIIALTAHGMPEDRLTALKAGMNDYFLKPISETDLKNALEKWISLSKHDAAD